MQPSGNGRRHTRSAVKILVTGSAGHLGEGIVRRLRATEHEVVALDIVPSPFTSVVGSICERAIVRECMRGVDAVLHAATLHKPHVATHSKQAFVDTNVTGTLVLLEEAVAAGVGRFVFTSTTSAFGRALVPPPGEPAAWITEDVRPVAKNIYGATKTAAESLCELFHGAEGLPCLILRTSRFFPEEDDVAALREAYEDANLKASEFLYRRVELEDAVEAHLLALDRAPRDRVRPVHHQRDHAVRSGRPVRAAPRRAGGRAASRAGVCGRVRAPRVADAAVDRSRVRQRPGPGRAGLGARSGISPRW